MTTTERIEIPGAHGGRLAARIEMPAGTPSAFALFAHCFTCTKDYKAVVRISRELAGHGFAGHRITRVEVHLVGVEKSLLVVLGIHAHGQTISLEIGPTRYPLGLLLGLSQGGHQDGHENRDDGNDDQ